MSDRPVSFDEVGDRVKAALDTIDLPAGGAAIYVIRDLFGKIGLSVSEDAHSDALQEALDRLSSALAESLGAHGRPAERTVVWVDPELLRELRSTAREITPGVFWVDRLVVGDEWWTVGEERPQGEPVRYTLHSVKGGMGRSTTAAVVAWHLARRGEDVLAVDFDIESPGLASAIEEKAQPTFGVADWFVEELVEQGNIVVDQMVAQPAWTRDLEGSVWVAPAHGRDPGEYLAKLGRVYMDTVTDPWTERLQRLLADLEANLKPSVVLVESRSGLHDIAAATVTDIGADVLLFAVDSPSAWTGYEILFKHWKTRGLATRIRERLSVVSALTPEWDAEYLGRFREKAWDLFRNSLYDTLAGATDSSDAVSYDFSAEDAPHSPLVIRWNQGLAAGSSLRRWKESAVVQAYSPFLHRFKQLHGARNANIVRLAATSKIRVTGTAKLSVSPGDIETVRIALSDLPEGTSHGSAPPPSELYLPPSHRKALGPNVMLVTGMRGSGKTFWWGALQEPSIRALLARLDPRLTPTSESDVHAGFGVGEAPDWYPARDEVRAMVAGGVAPTIIWRTVHARHLASSSHPLRTLDSWLERAKYVEGNPEEVTRLFRDCDDALERSGSYSLVLFDGLDRSADEWPDMLRLIRGLLRHALDMRSYRRLRAKVFLRTDQVDEEKTAFADVSKILSSAVQLAWPRRDLYGMLWQYLGNGLHGERLREWLEKGDWLAVPVNGQEIFKAPPSLTADEDIQRERFHAIAGPWMGTDHRRGFPYTWIPNHLGDANGMVSPRSFIAALRAAADDTADRHAEHDHALHYDSVKRGVQEASKIRVRELQEDYPWVDRLLGPLSGIVVPCRLEEIAGVWKRKGILDHLSDQVDQNDVKLPPRNIDRGAIGVRKDLESLGVFRRLGDDRVDVPDVFRVGYGLGRKGGVKPVR